MLRYPIMKDFIRHTTSSIGMDRIGTDWKEQNRNKMGGSNWIELERKRKEKKGKERVSKTKTCTFVIMAASERIGSERIGINRT